MIIRQDTNDTGGSYRTVVDDFDVGGEQLVIEVPHAPTTRPADIEVEVMLASVSIDGVASTIVTIEAAGTGIADISNAIWIKGATPAQFRDEDIVLRYQKQRPTVASAMQSSGQSVYAHA